MYKFFLTIYILLITQTFEAQSTVPLYQTLPDLKADLPDKEHNQPFVFKNKEVSFLMDVSRPTMAIFIPKKSTGTAVIICPGGGYVGVAMDHEGHDIARRLNEEGIAAFVLKYRMPDADYFIDKSIVPMQDVHRAMQIIHNNAAQWHIDTKRIGILGSSAGGHLAACAATMYNSKYLDHTYKMNYKPAFAILNYPVITFSDAYCHKGSRWKLVGSPDGNENEAIAQALIDAYSCENKVDKNTPPIFITHAMDDDVVPIENALLFVAACHQHGVKVQSFFYEKGGHGYGMNNPTADKDWIEEAIAFIFQLFK